MYCHGLGFQGFRAAAGLIVNIFGNFLLNRLVFLYSKLYYYGYGIYSIYSGYNQSFIILQSVTAESGNEKEPEPIGQLTTGQLDGFFGYHLHSIFFR